MKLDRLVASHDSAGRTAAHRWIATGRVSVDGVVIRDSRWEVDRFMRVELEGVCIQEEVRSLYVILHKPTGYLSATSDPQHPTVMDLIDDPDKGSLHLAGRLDRASSGLLLLTNDGRWSKRLMDPHHKVPKSYLVEMAEVIAPEAVAAFAAGFYFHTEDIHTLPAELEILGSHRARVTLHEGRYHQIKRMFHRVGNRVVSLHRERIGALALPDDLAVGTWRELSEEERELALRK
ncbi:pseudouridine synthase [Phragmitibacter flavus]|uniref:Pseudouridine synthase n=1 Tax=Phragmitibacter flavus TaxID=2576071 RepID=A0A5R8KK09_9BACT|nr:pseudouridine synthase [Phragmitibacter flavus]TLD72654.1 pseudouridine synthase [Phragmitibacter flavus]